MKGVQVQLNHILPREEEGGKPLTQGDAQTLGAGIVGTTVTWMTWIPDILQLITLAGTAGYVVFRLVREIMKFRNDLRAKGKNQENES